MDTRPGNSQKVGHRWDAGGEKDTTNIKCMLGVFSNSERIYTDKQTKR